jgi:hypothetical protein
VGRVGPAVGQARHRAHAAEPLADDRGPLGQLLDLVLTEVGVAELDHVADLVRLGELGHRDKDNRGRVAPGAACRGGDAGLDLCVALAQGRLARRVVGHDGKVL